MENTHSTTKVTPRFFFLSLGVLASLIASVTSFLSLVFETLNHAFLDIGSVYASNGYLSYDYSSMRSSLAILIILFPVFLVLSRIWVRAAKKGLSHGDGIVKKWMLCLVIFLASLVLIIDLVTLVRYFISGEITVRFILKVIATLVVAAMLGAYYFRELGAAVKKGSRTVVAIAATALVVAAISYSFAVMGSPATARGMNFDSTRINDLETLQSRVTSYWQEKGMLPASLSDLDDPLSNYVVPVDPESGSPYTYQTLGAGSFQLCATFSEPSQKGDDPVWAHPSGTDCFSLVIDPTVYPPIPKNS